MMEAKLQLDLAELKGPPLLVDLKAKKASRIADLDLLINSGKYEGRALERLSDMREKVINTELPTQDQINLRHERKIKMHRKQKNKRVKKN